MTKITSLLSILTLAFSGLFLGCFEEPVIDPVKVPYTSVRIGNFSFNVDELNISIDGISKGKVAKNQLTGYFDLVSGERGVVLTDNSGNKIFEGSFIASSYEEQTIIFDGYYLPNNDLNSFASYSITDGFVYLDESPASGNVKIHTSNLSPNTDTSDTKKYYVFYESNSNEVLEGAIEYNNTSTLNVEAGDYTIHVLENIGEANDPVYSELANSSQSMTAGMRYYVFLTGDPKLPEITVNEVAPLPVRSK